MKRIYKTIISILLLAAMAVSAFGCVSNTPAQGNVPSAAVPGSSASSGVVNLMSGVTRQKAPSTKAPDNASAQKAADLAARLFKACYEDGENCLVSPLSVLCALSMTANGAKGETLAEMEKVLGMPLDELNEFYADYVSQLPSEKNSKLELANSIWFTSHERFTPVQDFLQKNADVFDADIYKADFDENTLKSINDWVNDKTDGMIPEILEEIPANAVMYLINALAFDAEWERRYAENEVMKDATFTLENGETRKVEMLSADENTIIGSELADGFIKYYKGRKYAFAALLPKEGVSIEELIASLDGEKLSRILGDAEDGYASVSIPKFESEYSKELSDVLKEMGMPLAFDDASADFSGLGRSTAGNLYIGLVQHKTFISVDENGTRAGAATAVGVYDECAPSLCIRLDRPFVYMLIDCETDLPFFLGALMDPQA